jgi:hypothetical protein
MFNAKTVFIIGAGASWHYGYPTGEDLVKRVIDKARIGRIHCETAIDPRTGGIIGPTGELVPVPRIVRRNAPDTVTKPDIENQWRAAGQEFGELLDRLTAAHPLVIDYFLDHNPDLEVVGKFCIAWAILEAEAIYRREHRDGMKINYENDWCRFLIHKLTTGCPDIQTFRLNEVGFITFNYDVSLEYELFRGLSALKRFSENDTIQKFLGGNKITHVYGRIRKDAFSAPPPFDLQLFATLPFVSDQKTPEEWYRSKELLDSIYEASLGLNVISPGKASTATNEVLAARTTISNARCVYILGYGFDRANSELLELPEHLHVARTSKKIMFTNYKDGGIVNKNAARLFGVLPNELLQPGGRIVPSGAGWCEKSIKNVYDALAFDFDSPEDE